MPYEYHNTLHYNDSELKIIFHEDIITCNDIEFDTHWHKSPELLLITSGSLNVVCDGIETVYNCNELAIINNNQIHEIHTDNEICKYLCLIVDSDVYDNNNKLLSPKSSNIEAITIYKKIAEELELKKENYKEAVIGYTKVLFSLLSREKVEIFDNVKNKHKLKLVKNATEYIFENLAKNITLDDISEYLNISKFYLSRIFKEITGKTVISHLNYIRCNHAKSMLKSGKYNVAESAYASGYSNLSYFSKTYKKIIGNSPIKDLNSGI